MSGEKRLLKTECSAVQCLRKYEYQCILVSALVSESGAVRTLCPKSTYAQRDRGTCSHAARLLKRGFLHYRHSQMSIFLTINLNGPKRHYHRNIFFFNIKQNQECFSWPFLASQLLINPKTHLLKIRFFCLWHLPTHKKKRF